MKRYLIAAFLLLASFGTSFAEESCITPEQVTKDFDGFQVQLLEENVAKAVMKALVENGIEEMPYDQMSVVDLQDGSVLVVLFEKGCATVSGRAPVSIFGRGA